VISRMPVVQADLSLPGRPTRVNPADYAPKDGQP